MALSKLSRVDSGLMELSAVIAVIEAMTGLLSPAFQATREATYFMSCGNNLPQISLGLHKPPAP